MAMLRSIEQRIESLVEGVFSRTFRAHVQPVELARKLAKEMDDHRTVSVTRVYVPNEYTVYLAEEDREQFATYEEALILELQEYVSEHANRESYALLSEPHVRFETDSDLEIGVFGIATRTVQTDQKEPAALGQTMLYSPAGAAAGDVPTPPSAPPRMVLVAGDKRFALERLPAVIGRTSECDIHLPDGNVSRRHAEIRREGDAYVLVDLGSTNGTEVNGLRTARAELHPGDRITLGHSQLVFTGAD